MNYTNEKLITTFSSLSYKNLKFYTFLTIQLFVHFRVFDEFCQNYNFKRL